MMSIMLIAVEPAFAHGDHPAAGRDLPGWTLSLSVTAPLGLALALYALGAARLWRRANAGRAQLAHRAWIFLTGWVVLAAAIVSPLHEAGERSFALHMIEHEIIMLPASLLLVLSKPLGVMAWALPAAARHGLASASRGQFSSALWRWLIHPVTATAIQAAAMIAWHEPTLFDQALHHFAWHIAQHISFLASSLLFWWAMLTSRSAGLSAACLFLTSLVGSALGALMALSASPWYSGYAELGLTPYGLTPLEDQGLAGLVMWVPGGMVHAGAALLLLGRYLKAGGSRGLAVD